MPSFPARWTEGELLAARGLAEKRFILERKGEGPDAFHYTCRVVEAQVRGALSATNDLRDVTARALTENAHLWQTLRYFCAPPISEEDLWTLVGHKFRSVPANYAQATADALKSVVDSWRFPWLAEARGPTESERAASIMSSTVLIAHETLRTARRRRASRAQEDEVQPPLWL